MLGGEHRQILLTLAHALPPAVGERDGDTRQRGDVGEGSGGRVQFVGEYGEVNRKIGRSFRENMGMRMEGIGQN